jgi:tripartite-type tricarboxylate transporter receptor subunit TctC
MGVKDFNVSIFHGLYAPKGTPPAVLKELNDAAEGSLKDPEFIKASKKAWAPCRQRQARPSLQSTRSSSASEIDKWSPLIKAGQASTSNELALSALHLPCAAACSPPGPGRRRRAAARGAGASHWPAKPVRIVVPFAPGGTTDILARAVAQELTKAFGQSFVVENRAGAGGNIGADIVAKSRAGRLHAADGHRGHARHQQVAVQQDAFDPQKDFQPITLVAACPT